MGSLSGPAKSVGVVALDRRAAAFYVSQLEALFGGLIRTTAYDSGSGMPLRVLPAELFVVSNDAFESIESMRRTLPPGVPVVEIEVTFTLAALEELRALPEGTKALFVNLSEKMVREALSRLSQLGVNHLRFYPFFPGALRPRGVSVAVTPDEARYIPPGITRVIDIGQRVIASTTIVEVALRLDFDFLLERESFKSYFRSIAANNYSFDRLFGRSNRLESRLEMLLDIMDDGLIGVDERGIVFACNPKARQVLGLAPENVIGLPAAEVFPFLPFGDCLGQSGVMEDRLIRVRGLDVNLTMAAITRGAEYLGSFATVQRFTEEESRLHGLRMQLLERGHKAKYSFDDIIGDSGAIAKARQLAARMAGKRSAVMITGESGTGKELFAQAIHNASERRSCPFIAVNCAAIPDNLLESELFGYEDGAFTGARKGGKLGLFEFAHRGTLFLDEVEGMSEALQMKLLRVIQEGEVMRVGGNTIIAVDVRIIAATNEDLGALVRNGCFRKDLYYRLNALPLRLPALRERGDDLFVLLAAFKRELGASFTLSAETETALRAHDWSGNIRELRNCVEYLAFLDLPLVMPADLPEGLGIVDAAPVAHEGRLDTFSPSPELAALLCLAGPALPEYSVLLEGLKEATGNGGSAGRDSLAAYAASVGTHLAPGTVRVMLKALDGLGLARVRRGRGGSSLSAAGLRVLESLKARGSGVV